MSQAGSLNGSGGSGGGVFTVQTLNAVATPIFTIALLPNTVVNVTAFIVAGTNTFAEGLAGRVLVGARRAGAGAILLELPIIDFVDDGPFNPIISSNVVGNNLIIYVTGEAATTWNWTASVSVLIQS